MATPPAEIDEQLMGIRAVARTLDVSMSTIYNWVDKSLLPEPLKYGRVSRWRARDIDLWIAARDAAAKRRASEGVDPQKIAEMAIRSLESRKSRKRRAA